MDRSLNEIETHAKRAARGAGFSWGMADEAGRAARWLSSHSLDGPALLSGVLKQNDRLPQSQFAPSSLDGEWRAPSGHLCPVAAGAALNDCADQLPKAQSFTMINVSSPLLVLPFAAWAANHLKESMQICWQAVRLDTDGVNVWIIDPKHEMNAEKTQKLTCQISPQLSGSGHPPQLRGNVAPEIWDQLDIFAQRTYAPATAASRLLGAGGDIGDSD